jgi:hypothetical protein
MAPLDAEDCTEPRLWRGYVAFVSKLSYFYKGINDLYIKRDISSSMLTGRPQLVGKWSMMLLSMKRDVLDVDRRTDAFCSDLD